MKFPNLHSLQKNKYDHEDRAKDRLVKELKNPIIRQVFQGGGFGKEHRIVVFGHSGVGKTTLILKLLGAKTPKEDPNFNLLKLAESMRGSTKAGGAGTATVYQYKISKDNTGIFLKPDGEKIIFKKLTELKNQLSEVRKKVENNNWPHNTPVTITLPCQYFNKSDDIPWVITDIPGIKSNVKAEHNHVSELLKAHVLQCNVLLIVENEIPRLKYLKIPDFGPWQYFSRRCRLVVTHSLTDNSLKEKFRNLGKLNENQLISHYSNILKEEGLELDDINGIYPLDYGVSWANLEKNEKIIFNNVEEAMGNILEKLKNSLKKSLNAEEEYKALLDIGNLNRRFKNKINKISNEISELCKKDINLSKQIKEKEKLVQSSELKANDLKDKANLFSKFLRIEFHNPWTNYSKDSKFYDKDAPNEHDCYWHEQNEEFKERIKVYSKKIFDDETEVNNILQSNVDIDYSHTRPLKPWRSYLNEFEGWDEKYTVPIHQFFRAFKNRNRDNARKAHRKAVRDGLLDNFEFLTNTINSEVQKSLQESIDGINRDIRDQQKRKKFYKREINKINLKKRVINDKIKDLNITLKDLKYNKQEDLIAFEVKYPEFRKDELKTEKNKILNKIYSSKLPSESLEYMAYYYQIDRLSKTIN